MQMINRFKSRPSIATSCRELLKKQRADRLSGGRRRQRGNPLYLAVRGLGAPDPLTSSHRQHIRKIQRRDAVTGAWHHGDRAVLAWWTNSPSA